MTPVRNIDNELTGEIIRLVCELWGVSRADMVGRSRRRPIPWAREQLCDALRLYAGHDTVSLSALLKKSHQGIADYGNLYRKNLRNYTLVAENHEKLKKKIKLCNRTRRR
ncbi:MAG: hypothetical protein J5799_04660 [Bacteroidales bacterium]|nr:hypothetical protein [Bacteroidales bacterium]MBR5920053.1 hypothetical protein [Bacteroidales bacterium]